jgi:CRISPR-associated protein Cmr1
MPRVIKQEPPTLIEPPNETWIISLRTITPMFGGSATPREVDAQSPVRAASVRGHLRFWWRATVGGQYATPQELFKAEERLWGSADRYGDAALKITGQSAERKSYSDFVSGFGDPRGYALFPFARQGSQEAASCLQNINFSMEITCSKQARAEIEIAIQAWIMFGGIGARTRRGCGSLEILPSHGFSQPIQPGLANSTLLTRLSGRYLEGEKVQNSDTAWRRALEVYKDFRQGKDFARNPGSDPSKPNKLGRSRYPEPDTIRGMSPRVRWTHRPRHSVGGFPRADLGLPIVFHFIGEGEDHTLESASQYGTRFASPVITKAVKVEGGYAPAIVLLDAPHVWDAGDLKFERQRKTISRAQVELTPQERQNIPPLNGLPIREALLEFAKSRGFKEVRL